MIAFPVWINILPCFFGNLCVPSCQRASRANLLFICQMATIKILDSLAGFQGRAENILGKKNWHTVKNKQHVIQFSDIWNIMVFLLSCYLPTPPSCLSPNIWAKLTSPPPYLLHSKGIPCSSELQGLSRVVLKRFLFFGCPCWSMGNLFKDFFPPELCP